MKRFTAINRSAGSKRRYRDSQGAWVEKFRPVDPTGSTSYSNSWFAGFCGDKESTVTIKASGRYAFADGPAIDYDVDITFKITKWAPGIVQITGIIEHDVFPNYEVRIDGQLPYLWTTKGDGPGLLNLGFWQHRGTFKMSIPT